MSIVVDHIILLSMARFDVQTNRMCDCPYRSTQRRWALHEHYNPPASIGRPLRYEEWHQCAVREDRQAAGLLPPSPPGGPIRLGAYARAERAYQDWKGEINDLWEDERHRQQLVNEQAARACREEAACRQQLLDEHAARARLEDARRQQLLDKEAARARQVAAALCQRLHNDRVAEEQRQLLAAAQTIFLWLRRRRLHVRLARQTLRRQHHEAALARLRYEQECSERAAFAEKQHLAAAATAHAKRLADEAVAQRIWEALAEEHCCHEANIQRLKDLLADKRRRHEADHLSANLALVKERRRLADERCRHEAAAQAAALAEQALGEERRRQEAATQSAALAEQALGEEWRRHEAAATVAVSATQALAEERCRHDVSARAAASAELALAEEQRRHETATQVATAAKAVEHEMSAEQSLADTERRHAPPANVMEGIRRVQAACDYLAAPLDALLAEIETLVMHNATPPKTTSPVPPAMLSPPPRPVSYLDAVVNPVGRGHTLLARPLSSEDTSPLMALGIVLCQRTKPRRRTGRRNGPRAPSPLDEDTPSHPSSLLGGVPTPTPTKLARAITPCCSEVSYTPPRTPHTPSLFPPNFAGMLASSAGGNTHPFRECGPTPPHQKRTRRKLRPRCVCRCHGPRAPNQAEPLLCGWCHWPRAPNERGGWA
jgi:hypothetical protein